jgi:hypothetical protein
MLPLVPGLTNAARTKFKLQWGQISDNHSAYCPEATNVRVTNPI